MSNPLLNRGPPQRFYVCENLISAHKKHFIYAALSYESASRWIANNIKHPEVLVVSVPREHYHLWTHYSKFFTGKRLMKTHVMLDLETLGTRPGCKIVGIGATVIGRGHPNRFDQFEMYAHRDPQTRLTEDADTVAWWESQKPELRNLVLHHPHAMPITSVLLQFSEWLADLPVGPKVIWGNSASFDCGILRYAYEIHSIDVPWHFRDEMCFRTVKNLPHGIKAPVFNGEKHTPLADAEFQATWLEEILDSMRWELPNE